MRGQAPVFYRFAERIQMVCLQDSGVKIRTRLAQVHCACIYIDTLKAFQKQKD